MPHYSYYDEQGRAAFTRDSKVARTGTAFCLAWSSSYPGAPELAGRLGDMLGQTLVPSTSAEARRIVEQALLGMGLTASVDAVADLLPEGWRLRITASVS